LQYHRKSFYFLLVPIKTQVRSSHVFCPESCPDPSKVKCMSTSVPRCNAHHPLLILSCLLLEICGTVKSLNASESEVARDRTEFKARDTRKKLNPSSAIIDSIGQNYSIGALQFATSHIQYRMAFSPFPMRFNLKARHFDSSSDRTCRVTSYDSASYPSIVWPSHTELRSH
jgi:hypothetical protein